MDRNLDDVRAGSTAWTAIFSDQGIAPSRLGDAVIERLTQAIVDGRLKPGDPLPSEGQIAATFGISKPIAREALRELAAMGVIKVQQAKVSPVRAIDSGPLARFFRFADRAARTRADWRETYERHVRIADAVASGGPQAAERAMRDHFTAADAAIAEIFGRSPAVRNARNGRKVT